MLNLSRWTSEGGSYRTIQRFFKPLSLGGLYAGYFSARICWIVKAPISSQVTKQPCRNRVNPRKSRFFSSVSGKTLPIAFLSLSLVSVKAAFLPTRYGAKWRYPSPKSSETSEPPEETQQPVPRRNRGRPKGSRNRNRTEVQLSDTLKHLQTLIKALLRRIDDLIPVRYLVLDGYFGHNPALQNNNVDWH